MAQNGREGILKDFLEGILGIEIEEVKLGEETILLPEDVRGRKGALDVYATLADGTKVDIEMRATV